MAYTVLSRKYRPRTFSEVVGQTHITATLEKAIASGRIAQAYIFSGTRGTGKTTLARILAKALNCVTGPTASPCNACDICSAVDTGEDVDVVEIDGASHNSVEDIRELRANASYTPARSRYKIYYIDEVHMLSNGAFNALLKTLEEPPAHVKFIFATTEPHKIPLTIQSRCQRFDFRNIPPDAILKRLRDICAREGINADEGALAHVARFAQGSMRDAESLLDQVVSCSGENITRSAVEDVLGIISAEALSRILAALSTGDAAGALEGVEGVLSNGTSPRQFVAEFIDYLRDLLVAKTCGASSRLIVRSAGERDALATDAAGWGQEAVIYAMQLLAETYARMARSPQTRGLLDVAVVKLAQVEDFLRLKSFLADLRDGDEAPANPAGQAPPFDGRPRAAALFNGASAGRGEGATGASPDERRSAAAPAGDGFGATPRIDLPSGVSFEDAWPAIVAFVKGRSRVAGTVLEHSAAAVDAGKVRVTIPAVQAFHRDSLEKHELRGMIESLASQALGRDVRLEISCDVGAAAEGAQASEPASVRKKALREKVLEDPAVKKVLETFGGSLLDVEENDG